MRNFSKDLEVLGVELVNKMFKDLHQK